jgi:hypothetical protein
LISSFFGGASAFNGFPRAVSRDGSTIAGYAFGLPPYSLEMDRGYRIQELPNPAGNGVDIVARAVSFDGSVIVGYC